MPDTPMASATSPTGSGPERPACAWASRRETVSAAFSAAFSAAKQRAEEQVARAAPGATDLRGSIVVVGDDLDALHGAAHRHRAELDVHPAARALANPALDRRAPEELGVERGPRLARCSGS